MMTLTEHELRCQITLLMAPKLSLAVLDHLKKNFQTAASVFMTSNLARPELNLHPTTLSYLQHPDWSTANDTLTWLNRNTKNQVLTLFDNAYPKLLREINNPPKLLYVVGNATLLNQPQLAIVGSRNPTPTGCDIAGEMAAQLSTMGFIITSGMAIGIDAAAHRAVLRHKGATIAVLGNGLNRVYPDQHRELAESIADSGALVSELSPDTPPRAQHFPQRNRIISGLSVGTLVVEAAPRSGSLITAKEAAKQNREVFAIPGSIRNPLSKGCHQLIQQGAKLVESVADIIAELGGWIRAIPEETTQGSLIALDEDHQKLLECVGYEATSIDQLVARSHFSLQQVTAMLLIIEMQGTIRAVSGGYIRVTDSQRECFFQEPLT